MRTCPAKVRKCLPISSMCAPVSPNTASHLALSIMLQLPGRNASIPVSVIIDSGACSCFIDLTFATNHHISLQPKTWGLAVHLADGATIKSGPVTQETVPLLTTMAPHHQELLSLDAISSPLFPIILGMPWLQAHNPSIDWATGRSNSFPTTASSIACNGLQLVLHIFSAWIMTLKYGSQSLCLTMTSGCVQ